MSRFQRWIRAWRWPGAVGLAVGLVVASPLHADDFKNGMKALQANRYDEALQAFQKAASDGRAEGQAGIGLVWLKRGHFAQAKDAFQQAQRMDPYLAMSYYGEGEVLRREDKCEQAIPLFTKATELDRKYPEAQLSLGDCYVQLKNFAQAFKALTPGLHWGSKWEPRFLVALGDAELSRDSLRDAGIYYTRAREKSPDDPTVHRALGDFYMKRGTYELAIPEYQAAVDLDSSDVNLRLGLGRAMFYAQRYNQALEVYRDIVERDKEFAPGQLALGDLYYRSALADPRRYNDARGPLEAYTRLAPDDARGWSLLGRTYYHLGMKDEALKAMSKAEELGDKNKEMFTLRARLEVDHKEYDAALADYAKGEPKAEDQLRIAQVLVIQGASARAESLYSAIIDRDSSSSYGKFAMMELGKLRYRVKDYPTAVGIFNRLIALDPKQGDAYYYLGLSYKEMKEDSAAVEPLRQAAALAEGRFDRHFWLGMILAEMDSIPQSGRELERAVEIDSTSRNAGFAWRQLGYYALLAKDYKRAIRLLERAISINEQDIQSWIWYGQGNQNAGNRQKACEAYDRVLALDPGNAFALKGKKSLGCP